MASPVPLRAWSPDDSARLSANILTVWERATDAQRAHGASWYRDAHHLAADIANGDARKGAGVIAALSAQSRWERNMRDARAFCAGETVLNIAERLGKARRIWAGEDPASVLPAGLKTWHFWACIADPDNASSVVIDRHAHDIALGVRYGNGDRGLSYRPRYERFADAYREAAERLSILPSVLQATTWVAWIAER